MATTLKYTFGTEYNSRVSLDLPKGAEVVFFGSQYNQHRCWARVPDREAPKKPVGFCLMFTGFDLPKPAPFFEWVYRGTVIETSGSLYVVHLYEEVAC